MWYGELPERWEAHKLKTLVNDINSKANPEDGFYIGMENISSWSARFIETGLKTDGDGKEFKKGDILFGKLRPYLAKVYMPSKDGICSGEFLVFRGYKGNLSFLKYQLLTYEFIMFVNASTYGAKMPRANWQFIGNCVMPLPPRDEQDQIVRYLDWKVSRINKLINIKRRQIELFDEQKQGAINHVVTNEKRITTRIGHLYTSILGKMLATQPNSKQDSYEKYLCAKDVHFDGIDITSTKEMWFSPDEKRQYKVKNGDLLVVEGGAGAGGSYIFNFDVKESYYVQNSIQIIRSKGQSTNQFLYYYLFSLVKQGYIDYICEKATIPHFTKERLLNTPVPVINRSEQEKIITYLDQQCKRIDRIVFNLNNEIALFTEYRTRLISDVVTGKLDVRGVIVPEYEAVEESASDGDEAANGDAGENSDDV